MYQKYWHVGISILLTISASYSELTSESTHANKSDCSNARVLSRRKRYLIFPEGSSLQLVFCTQTSALIPIGDIFLFGNTAALAWDLPQDPELLTMFKNQLKHGQRRQDLHEIYYVSDDGKILAKAPYSRKPIVNPAFAKRSVDNQGLSFKEKLKMMNRTHMHKEQERREYLKQQYMTERSVEFHRRSRVGLYEKMEKLLSALGRDGRQCVLYKLCEARRSGVRQGTFLQELARIVFTLPKGREFDQEEHKEYDTAHHKHPEADLAWLKLCAPPPPFASAIQALGFRGVIDAP
ncbi:DM4/DM12 family domain-containing protein [Phthorimaea operculella]|nr:DM4/DM12 family domain-containing protein [Phthorimaea operculella]